jgi:hypothetical protein
MYLSPHTVISNNRIVTEPDSSPNLFCASERKLTYWRITQFQDSKVFTQMNRPPKHAFSLFTACGEYYNLKFLYCPVGVDNVVAGSTFTPPDQPYSLADSGKNADFTNKLRLLLDVSTF